MYTSETVTNEFLNEYFRSRFANEGSVKAVVNRIIAYEDKFNKYFYDFSKEEILQVLTEAKVVSERTLQNWIIILKHFTAWMIEHKKLKLDNVYETITKSDVVPCVDKDRKSRRILTREQINDIQDDLLNETDKAIVELLFNGVGGFALKELTFLQKEQVSLNNMCIYFKSGKVIDITERQYVMLERAFRENELVSYTPESIKVSSVISLGIYKTRANARYRNEDPHNEADVERRYRWLQRRIDIMKKYLDLPLTAESLQTSGLLHYVKLGMEEEGLPFDKFVSTKACQKIARQFDILSDLYPQIVKAKLEQFF